ncbi:hypothetical protein BCR37DRAFT_383011 [Protomyces lactucae-debilis]|uniref:Small nuclear ribonucleoprotein Sm D3 n=1 Tax=Protomyces lactucae-debilis TaxID=2754530 RepID=A0A1Y2F0Z4_PROLT|nr:uncharacterized protein BCR37DRAFT_383011 [Protomyces lactucae-debilis]ORY77016.1 hypothetical protein BCR37DRAFT_383011 [Protomyces lactucae-debilis]
MSLGIPLKLLHEATGHIVSIEVSNGATYRGKLDGAEDNMNVQLRDITLTQRDGRVSHLERVYIRGSHIRFFVVPDMLKQAPMFRVKDTGVKGTGRGKVQNMAERGRGRGR